jgi:hypothetical protein
MEHAETERGSRRLRVDLLEDQPREQTAFHLRLVDMRRFCLHVLLLQGVIAPGLWAHDAAEIVRRSVERDWTDFESQKNYTYQQHLEFHTYGKDGKVNRTESETEEILILGGRPYQRLIAKDGHPLPEKEARKEQEKLDKEAAKRQRESESDRRRYDKEREQERRYIRDIPEAFTFQLLGEEHVSGQPSWEIGFTPKPGYKPRDFRTKIITKIRGKIWIEQATYHWVKVDAEALDTISFGLGLLRIAPGGSFHFEQTRVNDEIWLPSRVLIRADARLALVKKLRAGLDITYREYKKFQSDSRIVEVKEDAAEPILSEPAVH